MKKILSFLTLVVVLSIAVESHAHGFNENDAIIQPSMEAEDEIIEVSPLVTIVRDYNNLLTVTSPLGTATLTVEGEYWGYNSILEGYLFYNTDLDDVLVLRVGIEVESSFLVSLTTLKMLSV